MKLLVNIPKVLSDILVLDKYSLLLAADDTVYKVEMKNKEISIIEIFRWTGTNILSISSVDGCIVASTDKGVIIFRDGRAYPAWIGYPGIVLTGKFYEDTNVIFLGKPTHKMSRIIDLYAFSADEILSGVKSLRGSEEEIVFFATNIGPVGEYVLHRTRDLIVKGDIDYDGYEELILITPDSEPVLYIIDFKEEGWDIESFPMPQFISTPIFLGFSDINADGEEELYVVSKRGDFEAIISAILFKRMSKEKGRPQVITLTKINFKELLEGEISDDGIFYVFGGEFDNDQLPEFIAIWEEPIEEPVYQSKLWVFKISLTGQIEFLTKEAINETIIKKILVGDLDKDQKLEIILLTEIGCSAYKLETSKKKAGLRNIMRFGIPIQIDKLDKSNNRILIGGPLSRNEKGDWSVLLYNLEERKTFFKMLSCPIKQILSTNDAFFLITTKGSLIIISDKCEFAEESITDLLMQKDNIYVIRKGRVEKAIWTEKKCAVNFLKHLVFNKDQKIRFIRDRINDALMLLVWSKGSNLSIVNENGKKVELVNYSIDIHKELIDVYRIQSNKDQYFLVLTEDELVIFNEKGEKILSEKIEIDDGNVVVADFNGDGDTELLYVTKGVLNYFSIKEKQRIRLALENITAMTYLDKENGSLIMAFTNNWVVEYDLNEVIATELR